MTIDRSVNGQVAMNESQSRNILPATFHPELTDDPTAHKHFLSMLVGPASHAHAEELKGCIR